MEANTSRYELRIIYGNANILLSGGKEEKIYMFIRQCSYYPTPRKWLL
jgi:hypothetical protein